MKVKIKILEFSSDIFSRSSQLKDIYLSPLFSNTDFTINIFEAISKNEEYEIKTNFNIIKIGLYQGKSLLGIGGIDINKISQKIKIASSKKNNQLNFFPNNQNINQIPNNDYYIILECKYNSKDKEKLKNKTMKDNKYKKNKNSSVDNKVSHKYNNNQKENKNKFSNSLKEYFNDEINNQNNKNTKLKDDFQIKRYNQDFINSNNKNDNLKSNSYILRKEKNKIIKNIFDSNSKNKYKDKDDNNSNELIFNESFQNETFSNGVLLLDNDNKKEKEKIDMENIEISTFNNIIKDFNLIYNNVNNNNSKSISNIKDNFILEYQYFLEKSHDIFNLYYNLSNKLNSQNINIKNNIINIKNKIKSLYKKSAILKVKSQNIDLYELKDNYIKEEKKKYNNEIKSINKKFLLINNMNDDILLLIKNFQSNKKPEIKKIFENIINKEKNNKFLENDENFIKYLIINSYSDNSNNIKYIKKIENNNKPKNENKIDIDQLKNKIDKLKNQYINESINKEYKINRENIKKKKFKMKNKLNSNVSNNKSAKNIHNIKKNKYSDNSNITDIFNEYKNNKYNHFYNAFTPNGNKRNKMIRTDF